jgi:hypothetical protein
MSTKKKLLEAAAGAAAGDEATYVDDVFSTDLWKTASNNDNANIPNALDLGDFGYGTSTRFNGTSDSLSRSSDLSGNADGKTFTFSCWVFLPPKRDDNQRMLYATDSSDNGFMVNIDQSNHVGIEAWDGGSRTIQATVSTAIGTNVWTHILISIDMANSSNRYVYLNDTAASVTWSSYNNQNIEFTRSTHYVGVWGNGTARWFYDDMAHMYLDYTYRDLSTASNRRIFIDANGGSTSASSLAALNPIVYLPMTTAYAVGKNAGTGGDFTANGSPTIVSKGTEYISGEGKGGLIWLKNRSTTGDSTLFDSERGLQYGIYTTGADAQWDTTSFGFTAPTFNADGYSTGTASVYTTAGTHVGWSFRKQEGFFDVVTWDGDGTGAGRVISHNLGSVPGMIIVKSYVHPSGVGSTDWQVYHRKLNGGTNPEQYGILLNGTGTENAYTWWNNTAPTSTQFTIGGGQDLNGSGGKYVAYLFAHDAQDFGTDSDESIIKCGSLTTSAGTDYSNDVTASVNLGFEPQWILVKAVDGTGGWLLVDSMRGIVTPYADLSYVGNDAFLYADQSAAEADYGFVNATPTGFNIYRLLGSTKYIYVAIRRPHKPASEFVATDLFSVDLGDNNEPGFDTGFPVDMGMFRQHESTSDFDIMARLTQPRRLDITTGTEANKGGTAMMDYMDGWADGSSDNFIGWAWRRAPGYFDVVTYTGNSSTRNISHNLGAVPEMMLFKRRAPFTADWAVYHSAIGNAKAVKLNTNAGEHTATSQFGSTTPTSSVFTVGNFSTTNNNGNDYIAYLFASLSGISKVGSYTGTGSNLNVDCGFTNGARFVLIKRSDSTGDWYLWDSVRGIVAGNDPYLLLNSDAAQVTNTDYIDPLSSGFTVTSSAPAALNASGGTYLFYAIA